MHTNYSTDYFIRLNLQNFALKLNEIIRIKMIKTYHSN